MHAKEDIVDSLRKDILCLQETGIRQDSETTVIPLGAMLDNMPGRAFPTGAIHEFLSPTLAASPAAVADRQAYFYPFPPSIHNIVFFKDKFPAVHYDIKFINITKDSQSSFKVPRFPVIYDRAVIFFICILRTPDNLHTVLYPG